MNLKSIISVALIATICTTSAFAQRKKKKDENQEPEKYKFEVVKENPITSIKDQNNSGTCWSFSAISFFESEILKAGYKGEDLDLSEMFVVSNSYKDKAEKFVRLHGSLNFGGGSSFGDALMVLQKYGAVPDKNMDGLKYGKEAHVHGELDALTDAYVNAVIKNKNRTLSTAWKDGFAGIVDAYLGEAPEKFVANGKEETPKSYVESLNINPDDYVDLTSWTHHPFYAPMVIEVPDNWRWETSYNLPIEELLAVIDNAIENGYTVAWASDVSEKGFDRSGVATVPDATKTKGTGSDQARWIGMSKDDINTNMYTCPFPEKEITQEMRQEGYDNYQTTDDHGMHLFGKAVDQNGKVFYMVKNSWGDAGEYNGIWYVSEAFIKYKTMDVLINKNAIPYEIRAKLNLFGLMRLQFL